MDFGIVSLLVIGLMPMILAFKSILIVKQNECVVIERLGKFHQILNSGFHMIIPMIDQPRSVHWIQQGNDTPTTRLDFREAILNVQKQRLITNDNVSMDIELLLYIQLVDPVKATYEVANLPLALDEMTQTILRGMVGEMDMREALESGKLIRFRLEDILGGTAAKWGIKLIRIEITDIDVSDRERHRTGDTEKDTSQRTAIGH